MTEVRSALILHSVTTAHWLRSTTMVLGFAGPSDADKARQGIGMMASGTPLIGQKPDFVRLDVRNLGCAIENCPECDKQLTTIRALRRELDHLEAQLEIAKEEHGFEAVPFEEGSD